MKLPDPHPDVNTQDYLATWMPLYRRWAENPRGWASKAADLRKAALHLRCEIDRATSAVAKLRVGDDCPPGLELMPVYMMLVAFAIENFLKGILIARAPDRVTNDRVNQWPGGGHDLLALSREANLLQGRDEQRLLLNLSIHAIWAGRYPCPLLHRDRLPRPDGEGWGPLGGVLLSDLDLAIDFCNRLESVVRDEATESRQDPQPQ